MSHENLDKVLETALAAVPSAIAAGVGFLAWQMTKDDPTMNTKRIVGAILLSSFTGGALCILLMESGLHAPLAAVISTAIGSSGVKGYELLLQKARNAVEKE